MNLRARNMQMTRRAKPVSGPARQGIWNPLLHVQMGCSAATLSHPLEQVRWTTTYRITKSPTALLHRDAAGYWSLTLS